MTAAQKMQTTKVPLPPGGPWGAKPAYAYCAALAENTRENYPVASWLLPKNLRQHVATIYAFASVVDKFADSPEFEGRRGQMLEAWEDALSACYYGEAEHPIFVALRSTIKEFDLPRTSFLDFIAAHKMDLRVTRYPTFAALLRYCEKSANAVGRIMAALVSDAEAEHLRAADDFTTGIQLLQFWSDIGNDYARGRIYIPEEDMLRFGVSEADIRQQRVSKQFKALLAFEIARTRSYLLRGLPLVDFAPKGTRAELQLVAESALCKLDAIERAGYDVYNDKTGLSTFDWARAGTATVKARLRQSLPW